MTYLSECGTPECQSERSVRRLYPATRADLHLAFDTPPDAPQGPIWSALRAVVLAIDTPFSAVADTLLLPFELFEPSLPVESPAA